MNRELRQLLARAGVPAGAAGSDWDRLVVLQNRSAITPAASSPGDHVWGSGFNLLALGPSGEVTHFCKCRSASHAGLAREGAIVERLSAEADLVRTLAPSSSVSGPTLRVVASGWIPGRDYERVAAKLARSGWAASMRAVLAAADRVVARATVSLRDLAPLGAAIAPATLAGDDLARLAAAGLTEPAGSALAALLSAGAPLPARLQHGDLWPGNVVVHHGTYRLLDFEMFGRIQLPMYDAFHFVSACWRLRRPGGLAARQPVWIDAMTGGASGAPECRAVLSEAAVRQGLEADQVAVAFACYLVDFSSRMLRRDAPPSFWQPFVDEAQRAGELLAAGVPLARVLVRRD